MYAKLVVGGTAIPAMQAMRDIARLLTSSSPSTALLGGFSSTSSVIVDATPAGWTYVGSNNASDQPSIAAVGATGYAAVDVRANLVLSAPCMEGSALKYAALSLMWLGTMGTANNYFCLTSATAATSLGVLTNEGPTYYVPSTSTQSTGAQNYAVGGIANAVIHVIANQRHITIIQEGRGMAAVWEMSMSDVNRFYGTAPMVQYCHGVSSNTVQAPILVPTNSGSTTRTGAIMTAINGVTDVNTGTFYGTYDPTQSATLNLQSLMQTRSDTRANSITAVGLPAYQVGPVFLQAGLLGHPTQAISGVAPVYWTKPSLGSTGDTLTVAGDSYMFFNCGSGFGMALKTY